MIAAAAAFIVDNQDMFDPNDDTDRLILRLARFAFYGGLAALGVNAASNSKTKEKMEEHVEERLNQVVPRQTADNPPTS